MTQQASPSTRNYFLQDSRGNVGDNLMFWARDGKGYTSDVNLAQPYPEDEAFGQHESRVTDVPWPTDYIEGRVRPVVDMQHIKRDEATAFQDSAQFYLESNPRRFVGNDILLVAKDGKSFTTNLGDAQVFSRSDVFDDQGRQLVRETPWPKAYIDMRCRQAVDYRKVDIKSALQGTSRTLRKLKKHVERYRCHACGIFLSAEVYYTSTCKCGAENRS